MKKKKCDHKFHFVRLDINPLVSTAKALFVCEKCGYLKNVDIIEEGER